MSEGKKGNKRCFADSPCMLLPPQIMEAFEIYLVLRIIDALSTLTAELLTVLAVYAI